MRCAIDVAPLGELADPRAIVRLAVAAEAAGWDGLSTWDSLGAALDTQAADPFVALAAVAAATRHLRLIASVIALPRRRPQLVAQAANTLDRLSGGRLVLGIGAGGDGADFTAFGESFDAQARVARMDANAAALDVLLRGARIPRPDAPGGAGVAVGPLPVQQPRPPIWLGGMRPGAIRRAAGWDGWIAVAVAEDGSGMRMTPAGLAQRVGLLREARAALGRAAEPLDVALFALSEPGQDDVAAAFAAAGATWWLESLSPLRGSIDALLARIEAGPPRA